MVHVTNHHPKLQQELDSVIGLHQLKDVVVVVVKVVDVVDEGVMKRPAVVVDEDEVVVVGVKAVVRSRILQSIDLSPRSL